MIDKVLEEIRSQKNYYRDSYRRVVFALLCFLIIMIILSVVIIFFFLNRDDPQYFASSSEGELVELHPLPEGETLPRDVSS